jgi:hypothetical protein
VSRTTATASVSSPGLFSVEARGETTFLRFRHHELAGADLQRLGQLWSFLSHESSHPSRVRRASLVHGPLPRLWAGSGDSLVRRETGR